MVQNKQQLVTELEEYFKSLDVFSLHQFPDQKETKDWLAEVGAILKNLDENDYQIFSDLRKHLYQDVHISTRRHAAEQIDAFIRQKVAEYKRYNFEESEKKLQEQVLKLTTELKEAEKKVKSETTSIKKAKVERAAVRFGKHFELQSQKNETNAAEWLTWRDNFFKTLLLWIGANVIFYFVLFVGNKFNSKIITPLEFFTIQYGLANFAFLFYLMQFHSRPVIITSIQILPR